MLLASSYFHYMGDKRLNPSGGTWSVTVINYRVDPPVWELGRGTGANYGPHHTRDRRAGSWAVLQPDSLVIVYVCASLMRPVSLVKPRRTLR